MLKANQEQEEQSGERLSSYGDVARAGCTVGGERTVQAVQMNVVCEVGTQHWDSPPELWNEAWQETPSITAHVNNTGDMKSVPDSLPDRHE